MIGFFPLDSDRYSAMNNINIRALNKMIKGKEYDGESVQPS